jgi:hypothetical protein
MALDYGIMPDAGGLNDQAAPFVDMFVLAWSERAEMAREKAAEEKRRLDELGRTIR